MIRKALRVLAAIVLFVVSASVSAVLTVKGMQSYVWRTSHREKRLRFANDLVRGGRILAQDLTVDWVPEETPTTVPFWRTECVVDQRVLAEVSRGDLVQPMLVENGIECLRRERPDEWSRD